MDSIKLTWLGHSCFVAEAEGYKICFDPYSNGSVPGVEGDVDLDISYM